MRRAYDLTRQDERIRMLNKFGGQTVKVVPIKKVRTLAQNNALHLWFELVANTLNDAGLDMTTDLTQCDLSWTAHNIKEYMWRPIQKLILNKESTTELTTKEIDQIFDMLNRILAEHGVHVPFPNKDYGANYDTI